MLPQTVCALKPKNMQQLTELSYYIPVCHKALLDTHMGVLYHIRYHPPAYCKAISNHCNTTAPAQPVSTQGNLYSKCLLIQLCARWDAVATLNSYRRFIHRTATNQTTSPTAPHTVSRCNSPLSLPFHPFPLHPPCEPTFPPYRYVR